MPGCVHVAGKAAQQRIERDHQHLKGRVRAMRRFLKLRGAQVILQTAPGPNGTRVRTSDRSLGCWE
jgi:hypothetical protein